MTKRINEDTLLNEEVSATLDELMKRFDVELMAWFEVECAMPQSSSDAMWVLQLARQHLNCVRECDGLSFEECRDEASQDS